jgi:hypothetical protein
MSRIDQRYWPLPPVTAVVTGTVNVWPDQLMEAFASV